MRFLVIFVLLFFIQIKPAVSQISLSAQTIQQLDAIATQDVPKNAPGIATAIIKNGKVIYEKYAGYADLEDSTLITSSTRFNIASNGKQFTALAILNLIEKNEINLSDDIRKWFPNLYPKIQEKITVQSLLNHTSGIRDCYDLWSLQGFTWWKKSFDNENVLKLIEKQSDLNFTPNTKYLYSNSNYILLALIIEKTTNQTFTEYTDEMFLQLNMTNTSFESDFNKIRGQVAWSYFNFDTWTSYDWIWNVTGDGNIFSSLEDQIEWEKQVQGYSNPSFSEGIITKNQQAIANSAFKNYGYGLEFGEYKGMEYSFHEGATGAWKATVVRFPDRKVSIITLTNTGKSIPAIQTRQMVDVVFDLPSDKNYLVTEPENAGGYVSDETLLGTYLTENDFSFTFYRKENKIFLKRVGRNDVELEREADNIFRQKFDPAFKQEFTTNSQGELTVTAYYVNHAPYSLSKLKTIEKGFDFNQFDGEYVNDETDTKLIIKHLNDTNYEVTFPNKQASSGLLVSNSKMLVNSYSLEFQNNTILLNGDRIKKVKYVRN